MMWILNNRKDDEEKRRKQKKQQQPSETLRRTQRRLKTKSIFTNKNRKQKLIPVCNYNEL